MVATARVSHCANIQLFYFANHIASSSNMNSHQYPILLFLLAIFDLAQLALQLLTQE